MKVIPYLSFNGRCEEALEFYKQVLGAKVEQLFRFRESPEPQYNPSDAGDKIMHACFRIGESTLMGSDGMCQGEPAKFEGISLSAHVASIEEAERIFAALSEGGNVRMPLTESFFSPRFGLLADKFGLSWMVVVDQPESK